MNESAMTICTEADHVDKNQRREKTANEKRQHDQKSFGYFRLPFHRFHLGLIFAVVAIVKSIPRFDLMFKSLEHLNIRETQHSKCS